MNNYLFMISKVRRRIEWSGEDYTFTRVVEDEYHRGQNSISFTLKGLYHQTSSYQQKSSKEGSVISKKPQPMILCLYETIDNIKNDEIDSENSKHELVIPKLGDKTIIGGKAAVVTGVVDIQELHQVLQISLEIEV